MAGEGVTAGVPDLFIAHQHPDFNGLFIEMKAGKNGLTDSQENMIIDLMRAGYKVDVCRSLDEFMDAVNKYVFYDKLPF